MQTKRLSLLNPLPISRSLKCWTNMPAWFDFLSWFPVRTETLQRFLKPVKKPSSKSLWKLQEFSPNGKVLSVPTEWNTLQQQKCFIWIWILWCEMESRTGCGFHTRIHTFQLNLRYQHLWDPSEKKNWALLNRILRVDPWLYNLTVYKLFLFV